MQSDIRESTNLLPCPFCGAQATWVEISDDLDTPFGLVVEHRETCFLTGRMMADWDTIIAAWNTRTTPPTSGDSSVERLREALADAKRLDSIGCMVKCADLDALLALSPAVSSGVGEAKGPAGMSAPFVEHIATAVMRWGTPHFRHMVAFSTLCEAIEGALATAPTPHTHAYTPRPAATDQAGEVRFPDREDIARILFDQRQTKHDFDDAEDADPESDEGTLRSIVFDDADAILALSAAVSSGAGEAPLGRVDVERCPVATSHCVANECATKCQMIAPPPPPHTPDGGAMVEALRGRPFCEWHEDHGQVLWWKLPIQEAPYVGSPIDLGRTMKVTVQVGREEHDLPFTNTGGWPFDEEDEPDLWWTPLPSPTFSRAALSGAN